MHSWKQKQLESLQKLHKKVAKKETKATCLSSLPNSLEKYAPGNGKANPTPATKGARTEASGHKNKKQSGKKWIHHYSHNTTGKNHGTSNSDKKYTTRKDHPRNNPGPVLEAKRDKIDKEVKVNNTMQEETDLQYWRTPPNA
jgi:hypothetical protein